MCKETKLDIYNISSWARTKCYSTLSVCVFVCNTFGNDEDDDENCFHHGFLRLFSFSLPLPLALRLTILPNFGKICSQFGYICSLSQAILMQKIKRTLYQNASFVCTSSFVTQKKKHERRLHTLEVWVPDEAQGCCGLFSVPLQFRPYS